MAHGTQGPQRLGRPWKLRDVGTDSVGCLEGRGAQWAGAASREVTGGGGEVFWGLQSRVSGRVEREWERSSPFEI